MRVRSRGLGAAILGTALLLMTVIVAYALWLPDGLPRDGLPRKEKLAAALGGMVIGFVLWNRLIEPRLDRRRLKPLT